MTMNHEPNNDDDKSNNTEDAATKCQAALLETNQKVEASLLTSFQEHLQEHSRKAGLDFLHVKNSLLVSYLIELVVFLKSKLEGRPVQNLARLTELKVILDKTRTLDKKMRYQIDKLIQAEHAGTFATSGLQDNNNNSNEIALQNKEDDPLQYRPDPKALRVNSDDDNDNSSSDEDDDNKEDESGSENQAESDVEDDDDDDDLQAAKQTIAFSKGEGFSSSNKNQKKNSKAKYTSEKEDDTSANNSNVYRAPRHTAMPYLLDQQEKDAQREKRQLRRMRTSELAQSLRHQYGEQPEQEDYHGGTEYGKQAQAARRMAERDAERTKHEEDYMMRLTVSRKEKKERKRLMRLEGANLNGIADLGNLVRDASRVIDSNDKGDKRNDSDRGHSNNHRNTERFANGKRKKDMMDEQGRQIKMGAKKSGGNRAKNSYQAALYGGGGDGRSGSKSNKKRSRR